MIIYYFIYKILNNLIIYKIVLIQTIGHYQCQADSESISISDTIADL